MSLAGIGVIADIADIASTRGKHGSDHAGPFVHYRDLSFRHSVVLLIPSA